MAVAVQERWEAPEAVDPPTTTWLRDAYGRLTTFTGLRTAGWVALVGGLVSLLVGLAFGWVEFITVGVLAVVTALLSLLFTIGRPDLNVFLEVADRSVVVGDRTTGRLYVRNAGTRRHWGSRLDLPVGDSFASFMLPGMSAGNVHTEQFRIPTERRGLVVIGPANSIKGDPFSLAGRETRWTEELELYVHPRTVTLPGRQAGFVHDMEGHASDHLSASDMNFHAMRPYVPGDDRRHVHWRSTARAGQLMVRQYEETRMSRVAVTLDTGRTSYLDEAEFELAVSCAASLSLQTLYSESPLTLTTSNDLLVTVTPTRTLDELSLVEQSTRGGVADLVHSLMRRETRVSIAMVLTGSSTSTRVLRQACARFDVDTRVVGLRIDAGAELRARTVGNVTILQVGSLDDLPRAMRKAME